MKKINNRRKLEDFPSIVNPLKKTTDAVENFPEKLPTENLYSLKDIPNKLTDTVENVTEKLPLPGFSPFMGIFNYIKNFLTFIFSVISNILSGVKTLFQLFMVIPIKIYLFTLKALGTIWSWIKAIVKACVNLIIKIYEFIIETISKIFLGVKILFQIFIAIPVKIYLFIVKVIGTICSGVRAIITVLIRLFTTIGKILKLLFLNPLSLLTNPWQSLKSIGNSGGEITDKLSGGIEKITEKFPDGIEKVTDKLSGGIEEVTDKFPEGLEKVTDKFPDGIEKVTEKLSGGIGEVTEKLPGGIEEVTDKLPGGIGEVTKGLLGGRQNKKKKNQEIKPLGKSKKKIQESDPPPSQQDCSELPTDIVEHQLPDEASLSGLPSFPDCSEVPTDIGAEYPDVVSPSKLPDTSDIVYEKTKGLVYIQDLYSNGKASNLYTLDITSGKTVLIGSMGMQIVDIAFCGNILYGIRWRNQKTTDLVRINPATAKTTIIGKLGNSKVASLAFSKHRNTLYAMGPQTLLRVNVKTGAGRIIKSYKSYYPFYCGGLAFDSKGRSYSDFGNNYNRQRYLMRLNNNGTPIAVGGSSGVKNSGSLDFYGDELFAIFNGQVLKYDLVSGKARFVTYTEQKIYWAGMSVKLHPSLHKIS
ncbi:MAG: hypothetical protein WBA93_28130 [Microcoleaceae cyanobacterium]